MQFMYRRTTAVTHLHVWRDGKDGGSKRVTKHLLSPVQKGFGVIHQSCAASQSLVELKSSTTAEVAGLIHGALHEELVGEVLLVQVACHKRLDALPVLGSHPEESGAPWCKTPLVKISRVEVSTQCFQIKVQLKRI